MNWNGNESSPPDYTSIYIGELNNQGELIGFVDLETKKSSYLTDFKISPLYGFVLSGFFYRSFSLQSSSTNLAGEYYRGSFIASLNDSLKLNECKYVSGGDYNLRKLSISGNRVTGLAIFESTCNFKNQSCFAWNDDVSVFQTTDIRQLTAFDPIPFPVPEKPKTTIPISAEVYPNPFTQSFQLKFSEPVNSISMVLTNAIGQVCKSMRIFKTGAMDLVIDGSDLSTGVYILEYIINDNYKGMYKLIKLNE